jgi:hypothetical protein
MLRTFEPHTRAKAAGILLALFSLVGVLVYELAHGGGSISAAPSQMGQQSGHPRGTAQPDLHPNAQTP